MTNDNPLAGRDLLRLLDLTPEEFGLVLDTAAQQKADRKSTRLNSSHANESRMPSSA